MALALEPSHRVWERVTAYADNLRSPHFHAEYLRQLQTIFKEIEHVSRDLKFVEFSPGNMSSSNAFPASGGEHAVLYVCYVQLVSGTASSWVRINNGGGIKHIISVNAGNPDALLAFHHGHEFPGGLQLRAQNTVGTGNINNRVRGFLIIGSDSPE